MYTRDMDRTAQGTSTTAKRLREQALELLGAMPRLGETLAAGLVGSVARGTAGERSDIDVFIVLEEGEIPVEAEIGWWDAARDALRPLGRPVSVLLYTPAGIRSVANWYILRLASEAVFARDAGGAVASLLARVLEKARSSGFEERQMGGRPAWTYTGDVTKGWSLELDE